MQTSLMQRLALSGLFMTVREGMSGTVRYNEMLDEVRRLPGDDYVYTTYGYRGQIAIWRTSIWSDGTVMWAVQFRDHGFGGLKAGWHSSGGISHLEWTPPGEDVFDEEGQHLAYEKGGIHFEPTVFDCLFEEFRRACAAYMKHYRFTSLKRYSAFMGDVLHS